MHLNEVASGLEPLDLTGSEELASLLTSAADLGIAHDPRPDHAAYIASWLRLWRGEHNLSNREVSIM